MIHTIVHLTGTSFENRLKKTNFPKPIQHALIILDELGLVLAIQTVKRYYQSPIHHSKIFLPLTAIQCALICERALWLLKITSPHLNALIDRTKKLGVIYLCNLSYPYFFIHEYGHALSAKTLFSHANPRVTIKPFAEGSTKFAISKGLQGVGRWFGKKRSLSFVTLGGLGGSILFAMGGIASAKLIEKNYPRVSHFLKLHALAQLTQEVFYAASFYWTSPMNRKHDLVRFCRLSKIPAYVPILTLIVLPILECITLHQQPSASHQ